MLGSWGGGHTADERRSCAENLLSVVDAGLLGVIFIAPYFFGGRHDVGRLVLISLIAVTAAAWFIRQTILPAANWPRTAAYPVLLLAACCVGVQLIPLPQSWLAFLSPRTAELLSLWTPTATDQALLGRWQTLSFVPHETTKSLAMLLSYGLLFVVLVGRIQERADIERLLRWIALSAVLMAIFGFVHYFTSDGRYFWFYKHPYRSPTQSVAGAFVNHNHFANFLVMGIGPLAGWIVTLLRQGPSESAKCQSRSWRIAAGPILLVVGLVLVVLAVLLSLSRGGSLALVVAVTVIVTIYSRSGLIDSKYRWSAVGLAVVVLGILSLYGYEKVAQRFGTMTQGSLDAMDFGGGRRKIWAANLAAIHAGGLFGAGAGSHRMIYPVYLPDTVAYEYSHAENSYLQIATENGVAGAALLVVALALCCAWCLSCHRHARSEDGRLCFGAVAGGLAASGVHSLVDFVWYIPACMSVAIVLAACVLRLSQLTKPSGRAAYVRSLPRGRWLELSVACLLIGAWCVQTYARPAMASIYWDRYISVSASNMDLTSQQWTDLVSNREVSAGEDRERLNEVMIRQLEHVVSWDPKFARARLRLAAKYIAKFELSQQRAENSMSRAHIRDAVAASSFKSRSELDAWLQRAIGGSADLLRRSVREAHTAVASCPLQGEGYLYLADLCFLEGGDETRASAYVAQALRVRPYDSEVLYVVGERAWQNGDVETALKYWSACFGDTGSHQLRIIYWLAGRMPVKLFLTTFRPDWRTLRIVWNRYLEYGQPQELETLLEYASNATKIEVQSQRNLPAAEVLSRQANMYIAVDRRREALACLEYAHALDPSSYNVRQSLADELVVADRFAEAEPHYRWCLARRPHDRYVSDALLTVSKKRLSQRQMQVQSQQASASAPPLDPPTPVRQASRISTATQP